MMDVVAPKIHLLLSYKYFVNFKYFILVIVK